MTDGSHTHAHKHTLYSITTGVMCWCCVRWQRANSLPQVAPQISGVCYLAAVRFQVRRSQECCLWCRWSAETLVYSRSHPLCGEPPAGSISLLISVFHIRFRFTAAWPSRSEQVSYFIAVRKSRRLVLCSVWLEIRFLQRLGQVSTTFSWLAQ